MWFDVKRVFFLKTPAPKPAQWERGRQVNFVSSPQTTLFHATVTQLLFTRSFQRRKCELSAKLSNVQSLSCLFFKALLSNPYHQATHGYTALHCAVAEGRPSEEMIQTLVQVRYKYLFFLPK